MNLHRIGRIRILNLEIQVSESVQARSCGLSLDPYASP
jgi:hypothetical protein